MLASSFTVLVLSDEAAPVTPPKRMSQIKYSDKKRVARFREYAGVLFEKRGVDAALGALIGDIVLDDELLRVSKCDRDEERSRGWAEVHWRPPHARAATAAEADGRRAKDEEGGDKPIVIRLSTRQKNAIARATCGGIRGRASGGAMCVVWEVSVADLMLSPMGS